MCIGHLRQGEAGNRGTLPTQPSGYDLLVITKGYIFAVTLTWVEAFLSIKNNYLLESKFMLFLNNIFC